VMGGAVEGVVGVESDAQVRIDHNLIPCVIMLVFFEIIYVSTWCKL